MELLITNPKSQTTVGLVREANNFMNLLMACTELFLPNTQMQISILQTTKKQNRQLQMRFLDWFCQRIGLIADLDNSDPDDGSSMKAFHAHYKDFFTKAEASLRKIR